MPTDRDGRLDTYARTRAFAPLDGEIERLAEQGGSLLLDIGSGEYPGAVLEHAARARLGALLKRAGMSFTAFIVTTADAVMMTDVPRLINAVLEALPDARIVIVLNEKSVFRRGVSAMIGVGVPSPEFNEIKGLKGSRRRR